MGNACSPQKYVSRILHTMGGSVLFAIVTAPYLFAPGTRAKLEPKAYAALGGLVLLSGLYNASLLQPKKMGPAGGFWRMIVYGGKTTALLICTPLGDKLFGADYAPHAKLVGVVLAYLIGAYARFYRELHTKADAPSSLQTSKVC
ncbi:hypothetical protein DIPPA_26849 [Diplonema papillatum]|nr:hypothetical protein DIPPA_26849 [Diplonema papillatum]KAJ9463506.1 hypothetical protein DIPPA_26849 [Diplonema papillatum]